LEIQSDFKEIQIYFKAHFTLLLLRDRQKIREVAHWLVLD